LVPKGTILFTFLVIIYFCLSFFFFLFLVYIFFLYLLLFSFFLLFVFIYLFCLYPILVHSSPRSMQVSSLRALWSNNFQYNASYVTIYKLPIIGSKGAHFSTQTDFKIGSHKNWIKTLFFKLSQEHIIKSSTKFPATYNNIHIRPRTSHWRI